MGIPIEVIISVVLILFLIFIFSQQGNTNSVINETIANIKEKYDPYSYKGIKRKMKDLGQNYGIKDYVMQIGGAAVFAFGVSYMYFYNLIISSTYAVIAVCLVPYFQYLNSKRIYSEFIFEQIQTYCTNTIMEFQTTQSFVKAIEGVYESGVLEDPVKSDVKIMIDMAYQNGDIIKSVEYMNQRYNYYMVRNMHQLFYQVTKEGSRDMTDILENMLNDIDELVEGVYKDRMDRKTFFTKFLMFGMMLYGLSIMIQFLIEKPVYRKMASSLFPMLIMHAILILNTRSIIKGVRFYNENVGAE